MLRTMIFLGFAMLAGCGGAKDGKDGQDAKKTEGADLTGDQGPQGPVGPVGPNGQTGDAGAAGPAGDNGPVGKPGVDGQSYQRALDGTYGADAYQLQISTTFYEEMRQLGEGYTYESGILAEFDGKLLFQPKIYQCQNGDELVNISDRDIADHVSHYKEALTISETAKLEALHTEQDELPAVIVTKQEGVVNQEKTVEARVAAVGAQELAAHTAETAIAQFRESEMQPVSQKIADADKQQASNHEELTQSGERRVKTLAAITEKVEALATLEATISQGEHEIEVISQSLENLNQHLMAVTGAVTAKQQERDELVTVVDLKKAEIASTTDGELRAKLEQELVALEQSLGNIESDLTALQQEKVTLEAAKADKTGRMEKATQKLEVGRSSHAQLTAALANDRQVLSEADERSAELTQVINNLDKLLTDMHAKYEALVAREAVLQAQLQAVQDELDALRASLAEEEVALKSLSEDLLSAIARRDAMDGLIERQTQFIDRLGSMAPFAPKDRVVHFVVSDEKLTLTSNEKATELTRTDGINEQTRSSCDQAFDLLLGSPRAE